jgi:hypothetical protein
MGKATRSQFGPLQVRQTEGRSEALNRMNSPAYWSKMSGVAKFWRHRSQSATRYRFGDNPNVTESIMLRPGSTLILSPPAIGVGPVVVKGSM